MTDFQDVDAVLDLITRRSQSRHVCHAGFADAVMQLTQGCLSNGLDAREDLLLNVGCVSEDRLSSNGLAPRCLHGSQSVQHSLGT